MDNTESKLEEMFAAFAAKLMPTIDAAAKAAVAAANPVAGMLAAPAIDAVDVWVLKLLGQDVPAGTPPVSTDPQDTLDTLVKHVAALTVATGHATSQAMVTQKTVAANVKPAAVVE